jgi:phosphoribosylaminoimidazole carboxylase (NCAIR synthetase)
MSKVNWKRKRNYNGKNKNYSISKKLRKDRKSNEEFEIMLGALTLEELIALKLELSTKSISNRMYGFPIWHSLHNIVQDAVFKYAYSATRTKAEAMRFLGLQENWFHKLQKKYGIDDYFVEKTLDKKEKM